MRPSSTLESQPRFNKQSGADASNTTDERRHAEPMTFFISRGPEMSETKDESRSGNPHRTSPVRQPKDLAYASHSPDLDLSRPSTRRRSTVKASSTHTRRRDSSSGSLMQAYQSQASSTPPLMPSREVSLPSSPKSTTSRVVDGAEKSDLDDDTSQAVQSSDEEDNMLGKMIQDSVPQLVMPSLNIPSRRPFTARGKLLGRHKIMVTGCKGEILQT